MPRYDAYSSADDEEKILADYVAMTAPERPLYAEAQPGSFDTRSGPTRNPMPGATLTDALPPVATVLEGPTAPADEPEDLKLLAGLAELADPYADDAPPAPPAAQPPLATPEPPADLPAPPEAPEAPEVAPAPLEVPATPEQAPAPAPDAPAAPEGTPETETPTPALPEAPAAPAEPTPAPEEPPQQGDTYGQDPATDTPEGRYAMPQIAQRERVTLPEAPEVPPPNVGLTLLAAFVDLAINNGRGAERILAPLQNEPARKYENYRRKVEREEKQAEINTPKGSADPFSQQMRLMEYGQREQRIRADLERKLEERSPDSDLSQQTAAMLIKADPKMRELVEGASYEQMLKNPAVRGKLRQLEEERANAEWLARRGRTEGHDIAMANRREGHDYAMLSAQERAAIAREGRAEGAKTREQIREQRLIYRAADGDMERLEAMIANRIKRKGSGYRMPIQAGLWGKWYAEGEKAFEGGSGMSYEDTELANAIKASALPDAIRIAQNAPNTEGERSAAFEKWFTDGTLGGMLRFIRSQRTANRDRLLAAEETLGEAGYGAGPTGRGAGPARPAPAPAKPGPGQAPGAPQVPMIKLRDPQSGLIEERPDTPAARKMVAEKKLELVQ